MTVTGQTGYGKDTYPAVRPNAKRRRHVRPARADKTEKAFPDVIRPTAGPAPKGRPAPVARR